MHLSECFDEVQIGDLARVDHPPLQMTDQGRVGTVTRKVPDASNDRYYAVIALEPLPGDPPLHQSAFWARHLVRAEPTGHATDIARLFGC